MQEVREFIADAGGWGVASSFAAAFFLAIGIWEHAQNKSVASFTLVVLSVPLFWIGAYIAWRKKRHELAQEISKRVRPELTASFHVLGSPLVTMLRLHNSSPSAAVNIEVEDVHYGGKVLRFSPPPTITNAIGALIDCEIENGNWEGTNDVAALFDSGSAIDQILNNKEISERLRMRVKYSNVDDPASQKTWVLSFEFWHDLRAQRLLMGKQSVEPL